MKVAKVMADARDETRSSTTSATRQAPQLQVRKLATEFGKAQGWKAHFGKDVPGSPGSFAEGPMQDGMQMARKK